MTLVYHENAQNVGVWFKKDTRVRHIPNGKVTTDHWTNIMFFLGFWGYFTGTPSPFLIYS